MNIEIYADGSDLTDMVNVYHHNKFVKGFTTNPTLMRKAKVGNYLEFVEQVTDVIKDLPVSFEVFADDFHEMERQAKVIASFGQNIFVKIPVTNTKGQSTKQLVKSLLDNNIKVNVTAVFTKEQIDEFCPYLIGKTDVVFSIFSGRIADTGVDPTPIVAHAIQTMPSNVKVLWASCREVYNIYEADRVGCHIVTASSDLIGKLLLRGKDLTDYSLETVKMFYDDARQSQYSL